MTRTVFAAGKIILSGEYAVVFGYPGIAIPTRKTIGVMASYEASAIAPLKIASNEKSAKALSYMQKIAELCGKTTGTLTIENNIPLGRGMGSSTALVIAIARVLLGDDCKDQALAIENVMNPGHSGLDFETIWRNEPVVFRKGIPPASPPPIGGRGKGWGENWLLIDTGQPAETTTELVTWVKGQRTELEPALQTIGQCTERLLVGESPLAVFPDHFKAQVALGVVPKNVQKLVTDIELNGGAAKVLGAGGRTGGGGMVLAIHKDIGVLERIAKNHTMNFLTL